MKKLLVIGPILVGIALRFEVREWRPVQIVAPPAVRQPGRPPLPPLPLPPLPPSPPPLPPTSGEASDIPEPPATLDALFGAD